MRHPDYLALAALCAMSAILISCEARAISFDTSEPGTLPPGWRPALSSPAAKWEVIRDGTAPSKPNVLATLSEGLKHEGFPVAILETQTVAHGSVSVKFKPVAGKEDQAGGVIWRYRDPDNYYLARANALENNVAVFKVQNGRQIPLPPKGRPAQVHGVERKVPSQAWSTLKVKFRNSRFSVIFNHRELFQVDDSTFAGPGKVGLWSQAGSVTYFDDFRVEKKR